MKKKVFREKYGINHDGSNYGNKEVVKNETTVISVKKTKPKKKKEVK